MKIADIKFSEADVALLEKREQELYKQMADEYNDENPNIKQIHQLRKSFINVSNWLIENHTNQPFKRKNYGN